jgi:glucose-1-phosphate adenylyltransferase
VIETAANGRDIAAFREKPLDPAPLPDSPGEVYASMGNYVFSTDVLIDAVTRDAANDDSGHDLGGNIIPMLVREGTAQVYDFAHNEVPGATNRDRGYWRDVGTLDAYYDASMDLISVHPVFNLYNEEWPILTDQRPLPPAKLVFSQPGRTGQALDSMLCNGVIVSGGCVNRSILAPNVRVHSYAEVDGSVLMDGVDVGRHAIVRNAIVDKDTVIPPGTRIGVDPEEDRARGFTVSENGITVLGKATKVPASAVPVT